MNGLPSHDVAWSPRAQSQASLLLGPARRQVPRRSSHPPTHPTMPSPNLTAFSALRARSYVFRLPLFTRVVIAVVTLFWIVSLQSAWDVRSWGALVPDEVGFTTREFCSLSRTSLYCGVRRLRGSVRRVGGS